MSVAIAQQTADEFSMISILVDMLPKKCGWCDSAETVQARVGQGLGRGGGYFERSLAARMIIDIDVYLLFPRRELVVVMS
eukprot:4987249-Amphidinium_carterae.1